MILDLMMPEMGGLEVLKWSQEHGLELPIIVLTGCAALDKGMDCVRAGISDYISKPFKFERLLDSVKECLERSKDHVSQAV
jgi:DNA-binding NtrC family response regulator